MTSELYFKCLSDSTRLAIAELITLEGELCVCELTFALSLSQPKISRHLALLREHQFLQSNKQGKWIYYHLSSTLHQWQLQTLQASAEQTNSLGRLAQQKLAQMAGRPERAALCCK